MREILFRGKLLAGVSAGEWAYGNLDVKPGNVAIITPDDTPIGRYGLVDPDTVGQFTGLLDKNGVKIFEGDIVSYNGTVHEVVFESRFYNARFGIVMGEDETWSFGMSVPPDMMEVIGNIYDNPSLLTA